MFKLILFFAFAGLITPEMNDVSAPVDYSFTINWNDESCSCGTITLKELDWVLHYGLTEIHSETDVPVSGTTYPWSDDDEIYYDCPDCYRLTAIIEYFDSSGKCCEGTAVDYFDGDELIDGTAVLNITMN
ncbi:MAG: hypothetical protein K8R63_14060 [Bacteroidales bacterium]|jgi:hypothetical protein|nr:hypothetical protein [Bacteroidales bacterium]